MSVLSLIRGKDEEVVVAGIIKLGSAIEVVPSVVRRDVNQIVVAFSSGVANTHDALVLKIRSRLLLMVFVIALMIDTWCLFIHITAKFFLFAQLTAVK